MQHYLTKPIRVAAAQWFPGVEIEGVEPVKYHASFGPAAGKTNPLAWIDELSTYIDPGDWVVRTPRGLQVLGDEEFHKLYDAL